MKSKSSRGYTLIELIIVITIIGIIASIMVPQMSQLVKKANQGKARSNLGTLRSIITIYYSDNEGVFPFRSYPDGVGSALGISLRDVLVPKYLTKVPVPKLGDDSYAFNGMTNLSYDEQSEINMAHEPPWDVALSSGPPGLLLLVNRPYAYDQVGGWIYYNNSNYDVNGNFFYDW
ncbi:MAG: prepilin-type N-terminal cleavage/methylation domain-containing protein [Elusimicrobia bacterium]|nr:prepilin-type N-terminal cleavage/methylation domain-containing protein [Elusimicrobiota bacterium]